MALKKDIVAAIAQKTELSKKEVALVVDTFIESIEDSLVSGEKVQLIGFGTFETRNRAERTGRNPQTGEEIKIAATTTPAFKAGKKLKELVKG